MNRAKTMLFAAAISSTFWHLPKRRGRLSEIEHLLNVAVQMGNSAVGGVDYAHYWPMRSQSGTRKPLLTDDGDLTPVSRLFGLFGDLLPEAEVAEQLLATQVYLWRMRRQRELGYVVVNMGPNTAQLELRELAGREIRVSTMTGNAEGRVAPAVECAEKMARSEPRWMEVPRQSVAVLRVLQ